MKQVLILLLILFMFNSCSTISEFYEPLIPPEEFGYHVIRLQENEVPKIIFSNDLDNDMNELLSEHYQCLGFSNFNGIDENISKDIITQCKKIGATVALLSKNYTDTNYGSTQYGLYSVKRFDYHVSYFVEFIDDVHVGLELINLDNRDRDYYKRNTGAKVFIVYKNSPAYLQNIVSGDIVIRINDKDILNGKEGMSILNSYQKNSTITIYILRDGKIINFNIEI